MRKAELRSQELQELERQNSGVAGVAGVAEGGRQELQNGSKRITVAQGSLKAASLPFALVKDSLPWRSEKRAAADHCQSQKVKS